MFATLNINIISVNAGQWLALMVQAFFMPVNIVLNLYRYRCTPVYRLNGRTAFTDECVKQRDRHRYLLFLLCVNFISIPTLHCLAAAERQPTKPALSSLILFPAILTRILPVLASIFRMSRFVSWPSHVRMVWPSPVFSTFAASTTRPVLPTIRRCSTMCCSAITKSVHGTSVVRKKRSRATFVALSIAIRMQQCFRLGSRSRFSCIDSLVGSPCSWGGQPLYTYKQNQ